MLLRIAARDLFTLDEKTPHQKVRKTLWQAIPLSMMMGIVTRDSEDKDQENTEDKSSNDVDSDEERRRYDEQTEEIFDHTYEQYVTKKDGSTQPRQRACKPNIPTTYTCIQLATKHNRPYCPCSMQHANSLEP